MHSETDAEVRFSERQNKERREDFLRNATERQNAKRRNLNRDEIYDATADMIRCLPQEGNGTYTTDELNATSKKIVDPLLDLVNVVDPLLDLVNVVDTESKEEFPLRFLVGEVIELIVCFSGGHFTVFGRVSLMSLMPCLWVGNCRLDVDALVRRDSVGKGFVYDPKNQD